MFKLNLEKAEQPKIKLPTSAGSSKKQESSRKTSISASLTMPKPLTVWITINCGKFWTRWEYQTTWRASGEICMQVRKQQLELDMEKQTGSKLGKEHVKAVYCHSTYLTYLQSSVQFSSVTQSCPILCNPMNHRTPGLPVHHQLPEFTQTHVDWVGDAIQTSHPLSSPSPPAPNPSQHHGHFPWINSSHEVAKELEFQPQHQLSLCQKAISLTTAFFGIFP